MSSLAGANKKLIVVAGPTASGKSRLGIELAQTLGGEIVSADSVAVYRHFDIGSAKPTEEERELVPHHLISELEPQEDFSAGAFAEIARSRINDIRSRGKLPIVVGGTGLYLRALLSGLIHDRHQGLEIEGEISLERLREVDPVLARRLHENDHFRIRRGIEYYLRTGRPLSLTHGEEATSVLDESVLVLLVTIDRELLYQRINQRCEAMLAAGLVGESRGLLQRFGDKVKPFSAIGYSHCLRFLRGANQEESLILQELQRDTRRFAKRQLTWWRNQPRVLGWREKEGLEWAFEAVYSFLEEKHDLSHTPLIVRTPGLTGNA